MVNGWRRSRARLPCAAIALAASLPLLRAATDVSGTLATSLWTEDDSPYRVTGELIVPEDVELAIEPGVIVSFDPGVTVAVRGILNAVGTGEKPIKFQSESSSEPWRGVVILGGSARAELRHFELSGSSTARFDGESHRGAFNVVNGAKAHLEHCWFHDFEVPVVESNGGSELVLLDSLIENSREGIHSSRAYARVERVHVRNVFGYSDSIDYDFDSTPQSVIRDCLVENNEEDDGIDLGSASALVENVVIRGIRAGKAVSMDGISTPVLNGVLIYDCQQGIVVKDSCTPTLRNVTVTRCQKGIDCYEKFAGRGGGHGTGENMIVWGNEQSVVLDELSTFVMTYSDVAGGDPGTGNTDLDPLFVDPSRDDFHLRPESPVAGAGKDGADMGAFSGTEPLEPFLRGDTNGDGRFDVSDGITVLLYLFHGDEERTCLDALDADDSGRVNLTDAVFILRFLLTGGPVPPAPYPTAGSDPSEDDPYICRTSTFLYFR